MTKGDELKVGDGSPYSSDVSVFVVGHRVIIVRGSTGDDAPIITTYGRK